MLNYVSSTLKKPWNWYMELSFGVVITVAVIVWFITGSISLGTPFPLAAYILGHLCTTGVFCYSLLKIEKKYLKNSGD